MTADGGPFLRGGLKFSELWAVVILQALCSEKLGEDKLRENICCQGGEIWIFIAWSGTLSYILPRAVNKYCTRLIKNARFGEINEHLEAQSGCSEIKYSLKVVRKQWK